MGTMLQGFDELTLAEDFLGLEGCNEILNVTRPDVVASIHRSYLEAGADCIETNTFGTNLAALAEYDIVVNLQGDEPFLPVAAVSGAIGRVMQGDQIGTAAAPLAADMRDEPSLVKVVMDDTGRALYFSRSAIPHLREAADLVGSRWWQHLGIYAYRREALMRVAAMAPNQLEVAERLEQLRALAGGISIGVALLDSAVLPGIDTPADLAAAEVRWPDFAEASR